MKIIKERNETRQGKEQIEKVSHSHVSFLNETDSTRIQASVEGVASRPVTYRQKQT